ncbi:adenosine kinase 2-like isoform X2 [Photinus pyralis]|uniref:adenosine kinase 2-like isoform X2 n=1 Tax=Photinus pyralis TaxID=7054 RepID=UPI0012674EE8|nr:adenosine kinase 2-like isoform X2 [Photinus pyralis]
MVIIVGFGNPLLDIIVQLDDDTILQKYNIREDYEKEETANVIRLLLKDVSHLSPVFAPGGCAQNTLRILQWILNEPNSTVMMGAVGTDEHSAILEKLVQEAGVHTQKENHPTGCSVVLIKGVHRALIAHIGAAQYLNIDDIRCNEKLDVLMKANLVYVEGFFVSQRVAIVEYVEAFCNDKSIPFVFNLSGVYMIENFPTEMWAFAQNADVLFGNSREYKTLIKNTNLSLSVDHFAIQLCQNYQNRKNLPYGKLVVITNGDECVICAHSGGHIEVLHVPKIDKSKFKDSNGAGDAFAAGFLAGLLLKKEPLTSMKWGCWSAQQIIQQSGCTIPKYTAQFITSID